MVNMAKRMVPPGAATSGRGGTQTFDFEWFAAAFRRDWKLFLLVSGLVFGIMTAVTISLKPRWTASVQLRIDPQNSSKTAFDKATPDGPPDQALVDTQVNLMKSAVVAREVVRTENLVQDREFKGHDDGDLVSDAATILLGKVSADRVGSTYLVDLAITSTDPRKAARLANAMAAHYLALAVSQRVGEATQQSRALNEQLGKLGAQVRDAEAAVAGYRGDAGIIKNAEQGTVTDQQVAPLASDLATAEATAATANGRLAAVREQVANANSGGDAGVIASPVLASLRRQRSEVQQHWGEIQTRYGDRHPEAITTKRQLDDLDNQIREEAQRTIQVLVADASAANAAVATLRGRLNALRMAQAGESRASVTAESLERQADAKRTVYNQLAQAAQQQTQQQQDRSISAYVVVPATPPDAPSFPNRPLFVALGFVVALLAGSSVVVIRGMRNVGMYSGSEVEQLLGLPTLALIPKIRHAQLSATDVKGPASYVIAAPASEYVETLRSIRQSIDPDANGKIVAICSSLPKEGKSTLSLSLARTWALSGYRVALVECDVRRPALMDMSDLQHDLGIAEFLTTDATIESISVKDILSDVVILPASKRAFSSADLFSGPRMNDLLKELRKRFDYVILDTAPALAVTETRTIAKRADAVILVVRWARTSRYAVRASIARFLQDGIIPAGVVLNMVDQTKGLGSKEDGSYYSAEYSSYYTN